MDGAFRSSAFLSTHGTPGKADRWRAALPGVDATHRRGGSCTGRCTRHCTGPENSDLSAGEACGHRVSLPLRHEDAEVHDRARSVSGVDRRRSWRLPGWVALACGLSSHLDRCAVHAGGLEQGAEHLGGPFGAVEGDLVVPAAGVAVVAGDAPDPSHWALNSRSGRPALLP